MTKKWMDHFALQGIKALDIDLIDNYNIKQIVPACQEVLANEIAKSKEKGYANFKIRALVVGIPNVGKSTFINTLAKRKAAVVGDKPGVTKSQQWIRINQDLELLDTPGILWPKFENQEIASNLAVTGAIKDEIVDVYELVKYALNFYKLYYPQELVNRYNVKEDNNIEEIIEVIAKTNHLYNVDKTIDFDRVALLVLNDIRSGRLGKITLDRYSNE